MPSALQYALEPVVQQATERLFGVTQLGGGPDEDTQMAAILRKADVSAALDFCSWMLGFLTERPILTESDLEELTNRAATLTP